MKTSFIENLEQGSKVIKHWWLLLIAGILFIIAGCVSLFFPAETYLGLSLLLGIFILVAGISRIVIANSSRYMPGWGWMLTGGILEILLGLLLCFYPGLSVSTLYLFVGFYIMFSGCGLIAASIDMQKFGIKKWGWILASGIISILFAFLVIANPLFGGAAVAFLVGFAFIFAGASLVMFSFKLRNFHKHFKNMTDYMS